MIALLYSKTSQFLKHLNSQHPCIQFTIEKEQNNHIDFLDMTVYHADKVLQTKWHIKPTNTFLYTNHSSESPTSYKKNAIRALYTRSQKLTSENENKIVAKKLVKEIFLKNGYSENYIEQVFSETDNKIQAPRKLSLTIKFCIGKFLTLTAHMLK